MIVAFTVSCLRQKYLRATVDSWARTRHAGTGFLFCLEPPGTFPVADFTGYVQRLFPGRVTVYQNPAVLGCLGNTRQAMDMALKLSDDGFAMVTEEDIEVADDVVEYMAWARDFYRDDPETLAVCAHARSSEVLDHTAVTRTSWFCPLGWGTWADRWNMTLRPAWRPLPGSNNPDSWDTNLQQLMQTTGKLNVFPVRSRSLHIGELSVQMGPLLGEHLYKASVSNCYQSRYPQRGYEEHDEFWPHGFHEIAWPDNGKLWV